MGSDASDPNLYGYVANSPSNATEPSGLLADPLTADDYVKKYKLVVGKDVDAFENGIVYTYVLNADGTITQKVALPNGVATFTIQKDGTKVRLPDAIPAKPAVTPPTGTAPTTGKVDFAFLWGSPYGGYWLGRLAPEAQGKINGTRSRSNLVFFVAIG